MNVFERLGSTATQAVSNGNPAALVATVLTTSHRGRLNRFFRLFAARFLEAFAEFRVRPNSRHAALRLKRTKLVLDLIRHRMAVIGATRLGEEDLLDIARSADRLRLVDIKKAA